jgi:hypothetical protein
LALDPQKRGNGTLADTTLSKPVETPQTHSKLLNLLGFFVPFF